MEIVTFLLYNGSKRWVNILKEVVITFKELVEILELNKIAPIHFHCQGELDKNNYIFFRYLGNEEKEALINGTHDKNKKYNGSDIGVHLPDLNIKQYYELEMKRNPLNIHSVIEKISYETEVWIKEYCLVWSIYCVLHEVGHWLDFINSGKSSYEFSLIEKSYREELDKEAKVIYQMNDYSPQKRILMEKFNQKYKEIPSEKAADDYAFSNLIISLNKVREKLEYTDNDLLQD